MGSLNQYQRKRNFSKTPEPPPETPEQKAGPLGFVVQQHAARRLHYDFRLELDGMLRSWALPKGPSLDPKDKRLAVLVEDHPLQYAEFEGVIPEGQYGAGTVIVWDKGVYFPTQDRRQFHGPQEAQSIMHEAFRQGKLTFVLHGHKLKGEWALVHMNRQNWLLIKHQDQYATEKQDILLKNRSAKSGHTLAYVKNASSSGKLTQPSTAPDLPGARPSPVPQDFRPMLATLTDQPFSDAAWLFEPKLDGIRAITIKDGPNVRLVSRNGRDIAYQFPLLVESLQQQTVDKAIIDGEVVAPDEKGRPSFQLLQARIGLTQKSDIDRAEEETPVQYYAFDLPYLEGNDLTNVELRYRKEALVQTVIPSDIIKVLDYVPNDGEILYKAALEHGLEGIMAKRANSRYEAGVRSPRWLKIKRTRSEDFVIGGYTAGKRSRASTFGSLLLGYYRDDQRLEFAGAVGTGFDESTLKDTRRRLDSIRSESCPFDAVPDVNVPVTWVRPILLAEVKFAQWTRDKRLRAPVFLRLRPDKPASEGYIQSSMRHRQTRTQYGSDDLMEKVVRQLQDPRDAFDLDVSGNTVSLNNLGKTLWPPDGDNPGITKRDYLQYLARLSPLILPHLRDRPLTLSRYPDGIHGEQFYQKDWSNPSPDYVDTVLLPSEHSGREVNYIICNNLPTLVWLGQLANLEWHAWFSRVNPRPDLPNASGEATDVLDYSDFVVFDIDPYIYSGDEASGEEPQLNRKAFEITTHVAFWLKEKLDSLSLFSFVKTSGVTGLHVYVPILRQFDYGAVRSVAETICMFLLHEHPETITMEWAVDKRRGKIFLDYNQNVRGKTLAVAYSPRAKPSAAVSTPLNWDELPGVYPTDFNVRSILQSLPGRLDPWRHILDEKNDLAALLNSRMPE